MAAELARLGVDVGGTFTDLVALEPDGAVRVTKVPSTPDDPARGNWNAVDAAGDMDVGTMLHGTTIATNALLERRGAKVALLTTAGFEDLLWLRRQERAGLYDLTRHHAAPLVERERVVGVRERIGAQGVVQALTPEEVDRVVAVLRVLDPEAVAIALLFSFRDASHERTLAGAVRDAFPAVAVVASADLLPVFREYERVCTTVAEAFLRPVVGGYVGRLAAEAKRRGMHQVRIMASNGGTLDPAQASQRATSLALSGPAGGVEGARLVAAMVGDRNLLTLDMGGTSADASVVVEGEPLLESGGEIGGVPLALPNVLIETVGAGGGSVAWVDEGGALRVGPRSAGAVPGPACYGKGGTDATVTDAVLVLGWLDPAAPLASELTLDLVAARRAVGRVAESAGLPLERCAEGIVEVTVATMVRALRRVSVERGLDPRAMTLVPFGGAGPLFTCRLAENLGMTRAVIPPHAGVLSALGLATAPARVEAMASLHQIATELAPAEWERAFLEPESKVRASLTGATVAWFADCRYPGQGYELSVPADNGPAATCAAFHRIHAERYGHADHDRQVEVVNVRVVGMRGGVGAEKMEGWKDGMMERRKELRPGNILEGPITIPLEDSTVRIEAGWHATVHGTGALIVEPDSTSSHPLTA
ncbi:MAG: hydantoinase/oxoprolinase family protein [Gemmatimonadetes bacterium]|nr:hydantoinase/oxoprolinase family protein [Gemmatimonadota bacterium]